MIDPDEALLQLRMRVIEGDVRGALALLNAEAGHRFTALYRFDDETLRSLWFYDREHPEIERCEDIPVLASYCVYVRERRAPFRVDDSGADERVSGHPKRDSIRAYCGVPLIDRSGRMFGTVCHFDLEPRTISDRSVALMQALAPLLQRYSAGASRNDSGIPTRDFHAASSWAAPSNTRERQSPPAR